MAQCTQCGCCEAQAGFNLCIFCEDGVPCPGQRKAVRPCVHTRTAGQTGNLQERVKQPRPDGLKRKVESPQSETIQQKESSMETKKCRHPQCVTMIRASNKSGTCGKHWHWGKVNPTDGHAAKETKSKAKKRGQPTKRNGSAIATICVTEAHLDRFWQTLSLEEKAELFVGQLG
jgi:hypothetical protein